MSLFSGLKSGPELFMDGLKQFLQSVMPADQIVAVFEDIRGQVGRAKDQLDRIEARLSRIESYLAVESSYGKRYFAEPLCPALEPVTAGLPVPSEHGTGNAMGADGSGAVDLERPTDASRIVPRYLDQDAGGDLPRSDAVERAG